MFKNKSSIGIISLVSEEVRYRDDSGLEISNYNFVYLCISGFEQTVSDVISRCVRN